MSKFSISSFFILVISKLCNQRLGWFTISKRKNKKCKNFLLRWKQFYIKICKLFSRTLVKQREPCTNGTISRQFTYSSDAPEENKQLLWHQTMKSGSILFKKHIRMKREILVPVMKSHILTDNLVTNCTHYLWRHTVLIMVEFPVSVRVI